MPHSFREATLGAKWEHKAERGQLCDRRGRQGKGTPGKWCLSEVFKMNGVVQENNARDAHSVAPGTE